MKTTLKLGALAVAFLLAGAGCTDSLSLSLSCVEETPWGGCITESGADSELLGSWQLVSQQVVAPAGTIDNPFNGRILVFNTLNGANGYAENWAPEVVTNDSTTCTTEGGNGGNWSVVPIVDDNGNAVWELRITPSGYDNVEVTCDDGGLIQVTSTSASTPLGVGPAVDAATGSLASATTTDAYVPYTYAIGEGGALLQIIQTIPDGLNDQGADVYNVFVFSRL